MMENLTKAIARAYDRYAPYSDLVTRGVNSGILVRSGVRFQICSPRPKCRPIRHEVDSSKAKTHAAIIKTVVC